MKKTKNNLPTVRTINAYYHRLLRSWVAVAKDAEGKERERLMASNHRDAIAKCGELCAKYPAADLVAQN